ncbi:MAG: RNA-directed DNA polymerase [Candidatus Magasanikbacteria bacterium]|nr:RNA-directed DNA polymerase [Candidatus Magasanikbacteria bacterium]
MPIGNVTSQIFANIYLNELDQFIKHTLKVKHYFRYADDFVLLGDNKNVLQRQLNIIDNFIKQELSLVIHPNKVSIKKYTQGIDFLGYVVLPYHIVLRTKTRRRMFRKLTEKKRLWQMGEITDERFNQSLQSYLGMLKHCRGFGLAEKLRNETGMNKSLFYGHFFIPTISTGKLLTSFSR